MYTVLDLFAGAGGMAEGFLQAGFVIPFASDKSTQAALTYTNRHQQLGFDVNFYCGDIFELSKTKELNHFLGGKQTIDVVCGGPPCQGFSLAGRRNPFDTRNKLVKSYIEILAQVQPKYFVMENVLGILSARFVEYQGVDTLYSNELVVDVLKMEFKKIGYPDVQVKILNACDFGVPQKRQRVIFLGTRSDISHKLKHPVPGIVTSVTTENAIKDLENLLVANKPLSYIKKMTSDYQIQSRNGRTPSAKGTPIVAQQIINHEISKHTQKVVERFSFLKEGENIKNMLKRLEPKISEKLKTKKQNCKRIIAGEPSPTLLTLPDDLVHYTQNRILTVREMARLQSFDDSFEFLGKRTTGGKRRVDETPQYTLVGNAVPPLLAKAIAAEVMKNLIKVNSG